MNEHDRLQLQQWFDGALDDEARAAFEQKLAQDPELQAEHELLGAVSDSLRRSFVVPDLAAPVGPDSSPRPIWPAFLLGAAAAAAVLLVWLRPWGTPPELADPVPDPTLAAAQTCVAQSWIAMSRQFPEETPWAAAGCSSPNQVPQYVQPLVPDLPQPLVWKQNEGVQFRRGVDVDPALSLRVLELVVMPSTRVFVFVVHAEQDPKPILPTGSDLAIFRAPRGRLVLYEITPLPEPRGLACLQEAN